jgi:serine/threonine-protein phosphatase 2B catalytic subunit
MKLKIMGIPINPSVFFSFSLTNIFHLHTYRYHMYKRTPTKKFPSVITIFSAPNYLDIYKNRAAVLKYANKSITIRQFNSTSHPYWLPNFMNAFTWSLPFVGAKITEMLLAILSICSEEELQDSESSDDGQQAIRDNGEMQKRREEIKNKIRAVGRMQKVFQILREEAEQATTELQTLEGGGVAAEPVNNTNRLGIKALNVGRMVGSFEDAKRSDQMNERLPTYNPSPSSSIFPVPSMRRATTPTPGGVASSSTPPVIPGGYGLGGSTNIEELIRSVFDDDDQGGEQGGVVEKLAEKIARGRGITGKHRPLKRYETTY